MALGSAGVVDRVPSFVMKWLDLTRLGLESSSLCRALHEIRNQEYVLRLVKLIVKRLSGRSLGDGQRLGFALPVH